MKNVYADMTATDAIELAIRSSFIHKKQHYPDFKYLGKKYVYNGFKTIHDKKYWKKVLKTDFHVVLIKADKEQKKLHGQLDRFMIINVQFRSAFMLFNINQDKSITEVNIFQDDLFQMHKYLIEKGYDIPDINNR